jgi:ATP-binding cassette subfamily C (CFTR/MRP) protein 1
VSVESVLSSLLRETGLRRGSAASSIFRSQNGKRRRDVLNSVGHLMTVEESVQGKVHLSVYKEYAKACSLGGVIAVIAFQCAAQGAQVSANLWLKHWSGNNMYDGANNKVWLYLGIYILIGWSGTICAFFQTMIMWVYYDV